jgi:hypothetical protein
VRRGSATGPTVFEGVLRHGRTFVSEGKAFWLRLGAASNLVVSVNGRRVAGLSGTIDVLLRTRRRTRG